MKTLFTAMLFSAFIALTGAEWHVDNVRGDDANPGTKEKPFRTFKKCLATIQGGDTLHLVPNSEPYAEEFGELTKKHSGTPEKPTVVDGHGARLTRLTHFPMEKWKHEGDNVYSLRFRNNVVSMSGLGYYCGFSFVFLDGKQIPWVKKREELVPNSFLLILLWNKELKRLDPLHNMLYVKLPEGKTPANVKIVMPMANNITVGGDYITVKNITAEWNSADSFDTHRGKGIVFENVRASWCMDQCMSHHSTEGVDVRFAHFTRAIDGGFLDISFKPTEPMNVRYYGCVIEKNFRMGGAHCRGGEKANFVLESCIIRDNDGTAVGISKASRVKMINCILVKGSGNANRGLNIGENGVLEMKNCTIIGFKDGVLYSGAGKNSVKIENCKFIDSENIVNSVFEGKEKDFTFINTQLPAGGKFIFKKAASQDEVKVRGLVLENCVWNADAKTKSSYGSNLNPEWTPEQLRAFLTKK